MDQIFAYCVAPAHVPPHASVRVVLVEQVVFASIEDRTVGVVHEVGGWCEVILRTPRLVVIGLLRSGNGNSAEERDGNPEQVLEVLHIVGAYGTRAVVSHI